MDWLSGVVLGVHLVSAHVPSHADQNDINLGVYARTETGWLAGAYRNTIFRTSVYAGREFDWGAWGIDIVLMYGYQKETKSQVGGGSHYTGFTPGAIAPAAALTYSFQPIEGAVPRVIFMPGFNRASSVFSLALEKAF